MMLLKGSAFLCSDADRPYSSAAPSVVYAYEMRHVTHM